MGRRLGDALETEPERRYKRTRFEVQTSVEK